VAGDEQPRADDVEWDLPDDQPPRPPGRVDAWTHRFRHHFSHTWLDRGGSEGDLMELNGWSSPQMLRRYGASARSARRTYDRILEARP
jgi:integrase